MTKRAKDELEFTIKELGALQISCQFYRDFLAERRSNIDTTKNRCECPGHLEGEIDILSKLQSKLICKIIANREELIKQENRKFKKIIKEKKEEAIAIKTNIKQEREEYRKPKNIFSRLYKKWRKS